MNQELVKPDFERIEEILPISVNPHSSEYPFVTTGVPLRDLADTLFEQFKAQESADYDLVVGIVDGECGKTLLCRKAVCLICTMQLPRSRLGFIEVLKSARTLVLDLGKSDWELSLVTLVQGAALQQWKMRLEDHATFYACISDLAKRGPMVVCFDGVGKYVERDLHGSRVGLFFQFLQDYCRSIAEIRGVFVVLTGWKNWMQNVSGIDLRRLTIHPVEDWTGSSHKRPRPDFSDDESDFMNSRSSWLDVFVGIEVPKLKVRALWKALRSGNRLSGWTREFPVTIKLVEESIPFKVGSEELGHKFDRCFGFLGIIHGRTSMEEVVKSRAPLKRYLRKHRAVLSAMGVTDLTVEIFPGKSNSIYDFWTEARKTDSTAGFNFDECEDVDCDSESSSCETIPGASDEFLF